MKTIFKFCITVGLIMGIFIIPQTVMAQVTEEWVARYNGPDNGADYAAAMVVDKAGNVYVTGESYNAGTSYDWTTIKYDNNGNLLWSARHNGSANGQDSARAITVDDAGNVYVAGYSDNGDTGDDATTIKYDSNGNQVWMVQYHGPGLVNKNDWAGAIALDGAGNVYVAGGGAGGYYEDFSPYIVYLTIKYDSNGNQLWADLYSGPYSAWNFANTLVLDKDGNVYVTGMSGNGITANSDIATIKYDTNGNRLWVARYNGTGNSNEQGYGVVVDGSSNVYVTGIADCTTNETCNYVTVKYDTNGNQLWATGYNGPGDGYDEAKAITLDNNGHLYVTGRTYNAGTSDDYTTIKYDTNGNQLWVARYNGSANDSDVATSIASDGIGNVYVTGYSSDTDTSANYTTIKYDASGNQLWQINFNGPENNAYDIAAVIKVDDSGNVYVTGSSSITWYTEGDYATIKYGQCAFNNYYQDADIDAYGNALVMTQACSPPAGYVSNNTDCDDGDASINPGVIEVCNGVDDNCNTLIDEGVQNTYYQDSDNDTYGNASVTTLACSQPPAYVADDSDCDDSSSSIYPGALEVCNGVDDNCNTQIDENVTYPYYADADGDGYGDPANSTQACSQPVGYVADNTDCDDNDNTTYPGAIETPNDGIDQDCDGFDLAVEVLINGAGIDQQSQTVAWNDVDNEYLVLWQDFRNGAGNPDIYGARLDIDGNVIATDLPVITQTAKQAGPWVSYGGSGYLAVWVDQRTKQTTGTDIYGAWILPDGTVSSEFIVTNAAANQRAASVIYNPSANNFLVTWTDDTNGANDGDVWGALINPGGGLSGTPFTMVTATGNQRGPYVRYDYGNSQYFMVWFDNRNGANDVYGSRVSASGTLLDGSGIVISNANGNQNNPRITDRRPADGISNFVLSWIDLRNGQADIYGALIDEFGTKLGSDIQIAGGSYDQRAASIDVDYIRTGQAVVSWIDKRNGTDFDIYRAQVDQSGVVSGEALVAGAATGAANNQQGPLVTYSEDAGVDNGFLFLWRDNRSGVDYDMYGLKVWP